MSIGSPKGAKTKHTQIIADIHTKNDRQREKKIQCVERERESKISVILSFKHTGKKKWQEAPQYLV